jgi:hypothetical protein
MCVGTGFFCNQRERVTAGSLVDWFAKPYHRITLVSISIINVKAEDDPKLERFHEEFFTLN